MIETARGCPFRCTFCSVWQLIDRSVRERSIESVCEDFATTGDQIFVADDLFWHHPSRSRALAEASGGTAFTRTGCWCRRASTLSPVTRSCSKPGGQSPETSTSFSASRPPPNDGLAALAKDTTVDRTADGVSIARELGYGVTGNFVIDPDWDEIDFERLWDFVARHDCRARASRS